MTDESKTVVETPKTTSLTISEQALAAVERQRMRGLLVGIGIALWVVTVLINRATGLTVPPIDERIGTRGPVN